MGPAILEIEADQRSEILVPGINRFEVRAAGLVGNIVTLRIQAAERHLGLLEERDLVQAQLVAHIVAARACAQMLAELAIDLALVKDEFVALMRVWIVSDVLEVRKIRQAHVRPRVSREAANR